MTFIQTQTDYIAFLYGLMFIILGGIAMIQKLIGHSRIMWVWLGAFGFLHGAHEWIEILADAFPQSAATNTLATLTEFFSFAALIEFARVNWRGQRLNASAGHDGGLRPFDRLQNHWPALALMLIGGMLAATGMKAALNVATVAAALIGGLWSAVALSEERRQTTDPEQRRWLLIAACALGAFSLAESAGKSVVQHHLFGLLAMSDSIAQISLLGVVHTLLAALTTFAVWRHIQRGHTLEDAASHAAAEAGTSNFRYSLWLSTSLIIVLAVGWYATEQLGRNAESGVRDRSRGATEILASHLRDEMARTDLMAALLAKSPAVQFGLERRDPASLAVAETALRQHTAVLESSIAFLMAPNGKLLAATESAEKDRQPEEHFGFLPYFRDSSAYGLVGKDLAVEPDLEQRGYYVSHPVANSLGQPLGTAVVKKVLAQTDKEFKRFRDWFLISPKGVIFLSSRPELLLRPLWPLSENNRQQLIRSGEFGPGPFTGALLGHAATDRETVNWEGKRALVNVAEVRNDGWTAVIVENLDAVIVQRLYGILATAAVALFTLCFFIVVQRETAYESRLASDQQRLKILNEALEKQATTDALTGLYNRLKFNALLLAEIDRANRYGAGFTLVMLDVDHFKQVNDTWGHQTGDMVLVNIARLARDTMRSSDALARWGGEEFIAILPMTGINGALYFTERVSQALSTFVFEPVPKVTCSFGVTEFVPGDTPETITQRVDAALYLAKERGRNRTEVTLATSAV